MGDFFLLHVLWLGIFPRIAFIPHFLLLEFLSTFGKNGDIGKVFRPPSFLSSPPFTIHPLRQEVGLLPANNAPSINPPTLGTCQNFYAAVKLQIIVFFEFIWILS